MSVMLPGDLVFVLNLIGFNWPTADEDKLRESARHWREYASELQAVMTDVNQIVEQVKGENSAESIDALEQHWRDFSEHLRKAHDAAGTVAEVLDDFAIAVEVLKGAVVGQLLLLAGELAATTGAAFLTFGVAEAAAPEEILLTQGIMRGFVREAVQKVERLIADKVAKRVVEHFLSIKNGLKALKAAPTVLKDFAKGLARRGGKDLEHQAGAVAPALHGTNRVGEVTSRGSWRKGTLDKMWGNAPEGATGGRLCPRCESEVKVAPGQGPRDWHGNHNPAWSTREFPPDVTRAEVRDNYQKDVELLCPICNLKAGARG